MRLVYIDESGRDDRYYFFGALIVDAHAARFLERELDAVAQRISSKVQGFDPGSEFDERDPKAATAMLRIVAQIRRATISEYVWSPALRRAQGGQAQGGQAQRPVVNGALAGAGGRGVLRFSY